MKKIITLLIAAGVLYTLQINAQYTGGIGDGNDADTSGRYMTTPKTSSNSPVCANETIELYGPTVTDGTYSWTGPDSFTSSDEDPVRTDATSAMAGTYSLEITIDGKTSPVSTTDVTVNPIPAASVIADTEICQKDSINIGDVSSGNNYSWTADPADASLSGQENEADPKIAPDETTEYILVEEIVATGCSNSDTVVITVNPLPSATVIEDDSVHLGNFISIGGSTTGGNTYAWTSSPTDATLSGQETEADPSVSPDTNTTYYLTEEITATGCTKTDSTYVIPHGIWTGETNSAWGSNNNWSTLIPETTYNVRIGAGAANQPVISSSGNICNNLTIKSSASLNINPGYDLTIEGDFANDGTFTISSDATGTGSIITKGNVTGSGNNNVNLYLTSERWWYVSSPVLGATSNDFNQDANNLLYWWNETNTGTHGWNQITSLTALEDMRGYAYYKATAGATTKQLSGDLHTGNYGATDNLTATDGVPDNEGYNLIGNPYPSPINLGTLPSPTGITVTNLISTVWYRENGAFATYNWTSGDGTNGGQAIVPGMQGFWVKVDNNEPTGGIIVTNDARTHENPHGLYKNNPNENNIFRLTVNNSDFKDEAVVGFYANAENGLEDYDSEKRFAQSNNCPEIYTIVDNQDLAINGYNSQVEENTVVPLGIQSTTAGQFKFTATNNDFNTYNEVVLEDQFTGKMVNILENEYEFAVNEGITNNRFLLHFGGAPTGIDDGTTGRVQIYAHNKQVYIKNGQEGQVAIYNILGKTVITEDITENKQVYKINMSDYSGTFVVKYTSNKKVYSQKVTIQ